MLWADPVDVVVVDVHVPTPGRGVRKPKRLADPMGKESHAVGGSSRWRHGRCTWGEDVAPKVIVRMWISGGWRIQWDRIPMWWTDPEG